MKKVQPYKPGLCEELESILENFLWVRDRVYHRHGVRGEQISLLRRALAAEGNLSEVEFSKQTGVPGETVCRAAKFLSEEKKWARLKRDKKDRRRQCVVATPKGLRELEALDREVEKEFFTRLQIAEDSKEAAKIAALAGELNQKMRDFVRRQGGLFK